MQIDEHMFVNDIQFDDIGIDSDSESNHEDEVGGNDDKDKHCKDIDSIELIRDYARAQSGTSNADSTYVDLSHERELTTPFHNSKLKDIVNKSRPIKDQSGGWYTDNNENDVKSNYIDRKLKERFDQKMSDPHLPRTYPQIQRQIKIKDVSIQWRIFGGFDFNEAPKQNESSSSSDSVAEHDFFQHEYADHAQNNFNGSVLDVNYRSNRRVDEVMNACLNHIKLSFYQFDQSECNANRLVMSIQNVEILDLIRQSNFHKFLTSYQPHQIGHGSFKDMVHFELDSLRSEPTKHPNRLEANIKISVLPLRLNIDQLALDFVSSFFSSFIACDQTDEEKKEKEKEKEAQIKQSEEEIYIQNFTFSKTAYLIDYNPRRVDFDRLRDGDYSQFIHLFPLSLVEINLSEFETSGCYGWEGCFVELAKFWAIDFATHQSHKYVSGIQPVRSLVNMGSGIADLVIIPMQQYQHDGRIKKGLQKGAKSAVQKLTVETLDLSDGLFTTVHSFLSSLESIFHSKKKKKKRKKTKYLGQATQRQPHNTTQGLRLASESFTKGIISAAHSLAFIPIESFQKSGTKAGVKSVLRGIPSAILLPMMGTTKALSDAVVGMRNAIDNPLDND